MTESGYAANGIKHCIRPCDMTGKSCAIILRQIHPIAISESVKYDRNVDLPQWFSSISLKDYDNENSSKPNKVLKYHCQRLIEGKKLCEGHEKKTL